MVGVNFFGDTDIAFIAIIAFFIFLVFLVYYLQTENMREGYPLQSEDGAKAPQSGPLPVPGDKTFELPHGRGEVTVPSGQRPDRTDLALARSSRANGSPYIPTGDPMVDGVGPAAWANRRDIPELDGMGHNKIRPMSTLPEFKVSAGRDPRGKPVVAGDGEVVGRVIDMWIDVSESLVRYLTVDLNPEGSGETRLIPMPMARIKADRVTVRSLYGAQFPGVPQTANATHVTMLEEEKITAWYAGGTLYAAPSRLESKL